MFCICFDRFIFLYMAFFQVIEIDPGGDIGAGRVDLVSLFDKIRQAFGIRFAIQDFAGHRVTKASEERLQ